MDVVTTLAGRYRLGPQIGTGGTADVFRATDLKDGSQVAVKLLRARESGTTNKRRFATEARATRRLNHFGIVRVRDAGVDGDRPFLVMDLVEGPSLADRIAEGPLPPEEVRRIGIRLAEALAFAHDHGVVHRDVKPGNVLLGPGGRVRLADFGIARLVDETTQQTVTGQVVGSPAYIAPEQVAAEKVGPEADVYSLGLVLFEALTGHRAFHGTTVEVAYARLHSAPAVPVSLGGLWVGAIGAMTARRPEARPGAAGVAHLLADPPAFDATATAAIPGLAIRRRRIPVRWSWLSVGAATLALLAAMLFAPRVHDPVLPPAGAAPLGAPTVAAAIQPSATPTVVAQVQKSRAVAAKPRAHLRHGRHLGRSHGHHKGRGHRR